MSRLVIWGLGRCCGRICADITPGRNALFQRRIHYSVRRHPGDTPSCRCPRRSRLAQGAPGWHKACGIHLANTRRPAGNDKRQRAALTALSLCSAGRPVAPGTCSRHRLSASTIGAARGARPNAAGGSPTRACGDGATAAPSRRSDDRGQGAARGVRAEPSRCALPRSDVSCPTISMRQLLRARAACEPAVAPSLIKGHSPRGAGVRRQHVLPRSETNASSGRRRLSNRVGGTRFPKSPRAGRRSNKPRWLWLRRCSSSSHRASRSSSPHRSHQWPIERIAAATPRCPGFLAPGCDRPRPGDRR